MHLYRYNLNGKLLNQVTKGNWLVNDIVGIDRSNKQIWITTTKKDPREKHAYLVNWTNGNIKTITKDDGVHNVTVNDLGNYAFDHYTNATTPRKIQILSKDRKSVV